MVFSSIAFLCVFLPVVCFLHCALPWMKVKNALLIVASLFFYAWGEPIYVFLMIGSVLANWLFGLWLAEGRQHRLAVTLAVISNIGLLAVYKYAGFFTEVFNSVSGLDLSIPQIRLPIGISFFTFQALSYVIDVARNRETVQRSFSKLLLYVSFFPQLIAGPIVKYHDINTQLDNRSMSLDGFVLGTRRFLVGLAKKLLVSNVMAVVADEVFALSADKLFAPAAWLGAIAYLFQIYFDFSGYSDMAIGLGHMFGFRFLENFHYPYAACGIKDFWRRWHISLSTWFREYLYIPLGGNRRGKVRTYINQCIVFFATGLWHGANYTFIVWGLFHGLFLILESSRIIPVDKLKYRPIQSLYTLLVVTVGFVIFRADSITYAWDFLSAMFTKWAVPSATLAQTVNYLTPYFLTITGVAIVASTPVLPYLQKHFANNQLATALLNRAGYAVSVVFLLLSLMALATDSYNPFIYFRF